VNTRAGICEDCGEYFTVTGGGLNKNGQCPSCAKKFEVIELARTARTERLADALESDGASLGAC